MRRAAAAPGPGERHARARVRDAGGVRGPGGEDADLEITVSTEELARDGGVVPLEAWDLEAYRRNPVVLLAHGRGEAGSFPIARAEWTTPDDARGELRQGWTFHRESPESELAATLYAEGYMRTASVSFRLRDWHEPVPEEAEALQAELGTPEPPQWIAEDAELLEVSAVSVPADPGALVEAQAAVNSARAAGLDVEPLERRLRALRRRCRAGDADACRRLARGHSGRERARRDVARVRVRGLPAKVVTEPDGTRLLALEIDGRERAFPLRDGESPEAALRAVVEDTVQEATRSPYRSPTAATHARGRPDLRFR